MTVGAHARHYNAHSIGICYEGGLDEHGRAADTRTPAQRAALIALLRSLKVDYATKIAPHSRVKNIAIFSSAMPSSLEHCRDVAISTKSIPRLLQAPLVIIPLSLAVARPARDFSSYENLF